MIKMYLPYAGIGARDTPKEMLDKIEIISANLSPYKFTLRSGGARGADTAFEKYAERKEIYLPWNGFNNKWSDNKDIFRIPVNYRSQELVETYHPAPNKLKPSARLMMARNNHQVLGKDLNSPSLFILCWTKDAKDIGGTSQAIRIARDHKIPVYNLEDTKIKPLTGTDIAARIIERYA
jgi:hypothetical protein